MSTTEYRGYQIRPHLDNPTNYIIIVPGQGGKAPKMFEGMFTHRSTCHQLIDQYLETKNAKAVPKS